MHLPYCKSPGIPSELLCIMGVHIRAPFFNVPTFSEFYNILGFHQKHIRRKCLARAFYIFASLLFKLHDHYICDPSRPELL